MNDDRLFGTYRRVEREFIPRTYLLTPQQAEQISALSRSLGVGVSELVRALTAHALADFADGRLKLEMQPAGAKITGWHTADS